LIRNVSATVKTELTTSCLASVQTVSPGRRRRWSRAGCRVMIRDSGSTNRDGPKSVLPLPADLDSAVDASPESVLHVDDVPFALRFVRHHASGSARRSRIDRAIAENTVLGLGPVAEPLPLATLGVAVRGYS